MYGDWMLTRHIVRIILQHIQILNHYVVLLETNTMLYVNYTSIETKNYFVNKVYWICLIYVYMKVYFTDKNKQSYWCNKNLITKGEFSLYLCV